MERNDTEKLLRECDAGVKMAVSSIDDVLGTVCSSGLKRALDKSKSVHGQLGNEIHRELLSQGGSEKEPKPMAKGMSWLKTNVKLGLDSSDSTVADLMTDGCNTGVKSLHRYLNQYKAASEPAKNICRRLADSEEQLAKDLQTYL